MVSSNKFNTPWPDQTELCSFERMNITMKIVMILCLLVLIQCRGKGRGKLRCKPGEKYMSNGKCENIISGTTGVVTATHYDNGLRNKIQINNVFTEKE